MLNFFSKSPLVLLLISLIFAFFSSYFLLTKITTVSITISILTCSWCIQLIVIQLIGLKSNVKIKLSWISLLFSFSTILNLNMSWFLSLWKYELILFIALLLSYWLIKLKTLVHPYYFKFLCLSTIIILIYLGLLIYFNQFNALYFTWAQLLMGGLIFVFFATDFYRLFKKVP